MPCHTIVILHHAMLCHAMPYHCHAMLYYAILILIGAESSRVVYYLHCDFVFKERERERERGGERMTPSSFDMLLAGAGEF